MATSAYAAGLNIDISEKGIHSSTCPPKIQTVVGGGGGRPVASYTIKLAITLFPCIFCAEGTVGYIWVAIVKKTQRSKVRAATLIGILPCLGEKEGASVHVLYCDGSLKWFSMPYSRF
jgi:hypothetical protein